MQDNLPKPVSDALGRMTVGHMRVLLSWIFRQRHGHVNAAPAWYSQHEAESWVSGWSAAMDRVWALANDLEACKSAVSEDDKV